ncbi:MAG: hypothetical protein H6551_02290 [Chitinophagales bacterium]|nr:hypothetical protein [Chitinophagaceae bacterium]MCB9063953.1 hypothetical protein [Chitinophagales bacterium]
MKKIKHAIWLVLPMMVILTSCDPKVNRVEPSPSEVDGWAPVYAKDGTAEVINSVQPREIENGGKIYVKGNTLYQVEVGKGIHVIDITDRNNPTKVRFINVIGAQEMSIKNNNLYTNNVNDLVVVDITNINEVKLLDRVSGVFHLVDPTLPPSPGYFECVDAKQGVVVGWEQKLLHNPVCRKN